MLNIILYSILPFLFILGFCITIHELGHFLFAKIFGIPVEKFSIGYGPPIIRKKIGETDFRIAYFPLGGYVKMAGEDEGEIIKSKKETKEKDQISETTTIPDEESASFYDAPLYKRTLVVASGPLFNIVSAFVVLFLTFMLYGIVVTPYMKIAVKERSYAQTVGFRTNDSIIEVNGKPVRNWEEFSRHIAKHQNDSVLVTAIRDGQKVYMRISFQSDSLGISPIIPPLIGTLKKNGPADNAGMHKGDRVIKINDRSIDSWNAMVDIVRESPEIELNFVWIHGGEIRQASITPALFYDPLAGDTIGQIGVFIPHGRDHLTVLQAGVLAIERTSELFVRMLEIFYRLLTRQIPAKQLGGPIAIFKLSTESAQWGFEHLLGLLVIISLNLGLINLFPIPALDGGHIVVAAIEGIRRKRFSKQTRQVIQQIGYAIIFLLIIFVTFNDITR